MPELTATAVDDLPILKADALKFLTLMRGQLSTPVGAVHFRQPGKPPPRRLECCAQLCGCHCRAPFSIKGTPPLPPGFTLPDSLYVWGDFASL